MACLLCIKKYFIFCNEYKLHSSIYMKGGKMEEIYEKYSKLIYNYLFSLTNNIELSQELMQETFYSAIKNIKKFKGNSSVKTWLFRIAQNKWKDYLKSAKRKKELQLEDNLENMIMEPSLESNLLEKDEIICLYKFIHKLDENTKEIIYLKLKSDFSFKEIGNILGKSEEWARITFYRGKQKLKEDIENEGF